jgi:hypothetical protein
MPSIAGPLLRVRWPYTTCDVEHGRRQFMMPAGRVLSSGGLGCTGGEYIQDRRTRLQRLESTNLQARPVYGQFRRRLEGRRRGPSSDRLSLSRVRTSRRSCGGRSWWAHFEFTRINIEPIILRNKIEDSREACAFSSVASHGKRSRACPERSPGGVSNVSGGAEMRPATVRCDVGTRAPNGWNC